MARTTAQRTIADVGEFGLIGIIRKGVPSVAPRLAVGIGDDTAAFRPTPGLLTLATCDIQVEGRHFRRDDISAYALGRRSAAINLSDIGAMGGSPTFALVSLALPQATSVAWVEELYRGLNEELSRFGAVVIGGNLSGASTEVVIDITLLGEVAPDRILRRSGARPGDAILVTGSLGASSVGQLALQRGLHTSSPDIRSVVEAHRTPTPRIPEGQAVGALKKATAMIDISDGMAGDLGHICEESGAGVRIFADRIPMDGATRRIADLLGEDPLTLALHGGEDYELVITCPPAEAEAIIGAVRDAPGTPVTEIGVVTEEGRTLVYPDGREETLAKGGWDHFSRHHGGHQ